MGKKHRFIEFVITDKKHRSIEFVNMDKTHRFIEFVIMDKKYRFIIEFFFTMVEKHRHCPIYSKKEHGRIKIA
jgi:hypothetical protein